MHDDRGKVIMFFFFLALFIFFLSFIWNSDNDRMQQNVAWCKQHGGTWFHREGKCIEVHEIKVPE